jgi:predicted DNA-binding transcriptional regulator YafY
MDMSKVLELHKLLSSRRYPVQLNEILQKLECGEKTFHRLQSYMKDVLGAPIQSQRGLGYSYDLANNVHYELPGLWFSAKEIVALGILEQLNESFQPTTIKNLLSPIKQRLGELLKQQDITDASWQSRIKIINQWQRPCEPEHFERVAYALLHRQRISINYWRWDDDSYQQRSISPQRLVYYRDNWYLDAWCHLRQDLRTFSVDSIQSITDDSTPAQEIDPDRITQHVSTGYGIFSGQANQQAQLKFSSTLAKRISRENWHPGQQATWSDQGDYLLSVPYSDDRELLRDILRYGADVEVIAPLELRDKVKHELQRTLKKYSDTPII